MNAVNAESTETVGAIRAVIYLTVFALLAAVLLSSIYDATRQRIAENELEERLSALRAVLPDTAYNNQPHLDQIEISDLELLGSEDPLPVYRARLSDRAVAAVMTVVAPNGFSGDIRLLVGIDTAARLTGVRVIQHRETPGLGDAIEADKSDWIQSFMGLDGAGLAENPLIPAWMLDSNGGGFDHITSATVTSRAVLGAARNAVIYFHLHREYIFDTPSIVIPDDAT